MPDARLLDGRGLLVGVQVDGYADRLLHVPGRIALLVRPDGYVAWASQSGADRGLAEALHRWFGRPAVAAKPGR